MFTKIHHIGVVTDDLERTKNLFVEKLGCEPNRVQEADTGWAKVLFIRLGDIEIEFTEPYDPENYYTKLLAKNGVCFSHLALSVEDTGKAGQYFVDKDVKFLEGFGPGTYTPRGYEILFLDPEEAEGLMIQVASDNPAIDRGY